jgi:hypothetical protein
LPLYDVTLEEAEEVLRKMLDHWHNHPRRPQRLLLFRFYLARALEHAQAWRMTTEVAGPWRKLPPLHFSTWPEIPATRDLTRTRGLRIPSTIC